MKLIIIICEGETEQEFCKILLYPHFSNKGIILKRKLIGKSNGGIVHWNSLKNEIETYLKQNKDAYVTTLIDYYGIQSKHNFPNWKDKIKLVDKNKKMDFIEFSMKNDISEDLNHRFIPYVQLHEFEGLLFNNILSFKNQINANEFKNLGELEKIIEDYPNPELINDNPNTAPSKRLLKLINGYKKTVLGPLIAEEIGLDNIRAKAPRFNNWISTLENI